MYFKDQEKCNKVYNFGEFFVINPINKGEKGKSVKSEYRQFPLFLFFSFPVAKPKGVRRQLTTATLTENHSLYLSFQRRQSNQMGGVNNGTLSLSLSPVWLLRKSQREKKKVKLARIYFPNSIFPSPFPHFLSNQTITHN